MFLKNRKIISKMKRSKVTDYAALKGAKSKEMYMKGVQIFVSFVMKDLSHCVHKFVWL